MGPQGAAILRCSSSHAAPTYLSSLLQRGVVSVLQLLPRFVVQHAIPILTATFAAAFFTFLSLVPSILLFSLIGVLAFTIYRLAAASTAAMAFLEEEDEPTSPSPQLCPIPTSPPTSTGSTLTVSLPSNNTSSPSSPSPSRPRPHRRRLATPRPSLLETVPEAAAATHSLPHSRRRRVCPELAIPEATWQPPASTVELLSADGSAVSDLQLAACVYRTGMGLTSPPSYSALSQQAQQVGRLLLASRQAVGFDGGVPAEDSRQSGRHCQVCGGSTACGCRCSSSSGDGSPGSSYRSLTGGWNGDLSGMGGQAVSAGPQTLFTQAYQLGASAWPYFSVPLAVACVPVAVCCAVPLAVPLICTYGALRIGVCAVRVGTSAAFDCLPSCMQMS